MGRPAVVMAKWLAGLTALLTARVRAALGTPDCRFSVQCEVIVLLVLSEAITGPTEFIIFLVNSVKIVNIPYA